MKTIDIIRSGNGAYHLMENIDTLPDFRLQQVAVRSKEKVLDLVSGDLILTDIKNLNPADLTITAVTADAIKISSDEIPYQHHLRLHTSGSTSMQMLNNK